MVYNLPCILFLITFPVLSISEHLNQFWAALQIYLPCLAGNVGENPDHLFFRCIPPVGEELGHGGLEEGPGEPSVCPVRCERQIRWAVRLAWGRNDAYDAIFGTFGVRALLIQPAPRAACLSLPV
jgi:hypothetical protein